MKVRNIIRSVAAASAIAWGAGCTVVVDDRPPPPRVVVVSKPVYVPEPVVIVRPAPIPVYRVPVIVIPGYPHGRPGPVYHHGRPGPFRDAPRGAYYR